MNLLDIPLLPGAKRLGHLGEFVNDRDGFLRRVNREGGDLTRMIVLSCDGTVRR